MFRWWKAKGREVSLSAEQWHELTHHVPLLRGLNDDERARLIALVERFLADKHFEGGTGFEVTDTMKLVIAAHACLLLVHRADEVPYPKLVSIIVYPSAWRTTNRQHVGGGVVLEQRGANLGESWSDDSVILAWDRVARDAARVSDGQNVALHEFAHQLDAQDGAVDGAPALPTRAHYVEWARVLGAEFEALRQGEDSVIDDYGAQSPPEFFAVVTEVFFERPSELEAERPELFAQLVGFYGFDPHTLHERL